MNKTKYQINSDNIKSNSEETSAISSISYEIENANNNDLNNASIQTQIEILKSQNSFPKNLSYLKSYTDPKTGTTTSAFLNKDTGKVTLGMTGTNVHKDAILKQTFGVPSYQGYIDASETLKDIGAMSILAFIPSQIKIHIIKIPKTLSKISKKTMILILLPDIRWAVEMR